MQKIHFPGHIPTPAEQRLSLRAPDLLARSNLFLLHIGLVLAMVLTSAYSQSPSIPLEVKLNMNRQMINTTRIEADFDEHPYFFDGLNIQFRYLLTDNLKITLLAGYDYQKIYQSGVLNTWEWDYWEDTYIDFLPGAELAEVNTKHFYQSGDSIYAAIFKPAQSLKEIILATGLNYTHHLGKKVNINAGIEFGVTLFNRELRMHEKWTKRFDLDTTSAQKFDYEYNYELLHFAPPKSGVRLLISPSIGINYNMSAGVALEMNFRYYQYISRRDAEAVEKFFKIPSSNDKWFPLSSKYQLQIGVVIKY